MPQTHIYPVKSSFGGLSKEAFNRASDYSFSPVDPSTIFRTYEAGPTEEKQSALRTINN